MKSRRQTIHLLGRDIPVLVAGDGTLQGEDDGKPASRGVLSYVSRAFRIRPAEGQAAMEALTESLPPEELNRVGFRLYERFRPEVPEGAQVGERRENCELTPSRMLRDDSSWRLPGAEA